MTDPPRPDVLVGGAEREPGELWRRVPGWGSVAAALTAVLGAGVVTLATGAARPTVVPLPPLGALGPADVRVDDGGLLVRVEAELRTREPVVLLDAQVTGGGLVVLLDPVADRRAGVPGAVQQRVVALVDPRCRRDGPPRAGEQPVVEVVVQAQDGGAPTTLSSPVPVRGLANAARTACQPVRATVGRLPGATDAAARQVEVTVELVENAVPTRVVGLTGRGLVVELAASPLAEELARLSGTGARAAVTVTGRVVVTDCAVEVLAPRGLVLELERGSGEAAARLRVPVDTEPEAVAGIDELVRQTCRRARL